MTDLEDFVALLDRWGVPYKQSEPTAVKTPVWMDPLTGPVVRVQVNGYGHPMFDGHSGFVTRAVFDEAGAFLAWGSWE